MVQLSIDGTPVLFTIRLTTYDALLQAIVRQVKTNKILPIFYLDKVSNTYIRLQHDDIEPLCRKTHMKLRLSGTEVVPYEGELNSEGKKHGQGMYRWPNGRTYVGEWCDNQMHGEGVESWPNGSRYRGQFRANRRQGHGTFTWPDRRQYTGRIFYHRRSRISFSSSGEYHNDLRSGYGVCTYPNGYRYEGEWVKGKKQGRGIEIFHNGDRFNGMFENDKAVEPSTH